MYVKGIISVIVNRDSALNMLSTANSAVIAQVPVYVLGDMFANFKLFLEF